MLWAKAAIAGGLLVLVAGFGLGTQPRSAPVGDQTFYCGAAISSSWLVSGTPGQTQNEGPKASADDRRAAAACRATSRVVIFSGMGLGALLVIVGWSVVVDAGRPETRRMVPSRA